MKLCHEIGRSPDLEGAVEKDLEFSLHRILHPVHPLDKALLKDVSLRLQVIIFFDCGAMGRGAARARCLRLQGWLFHNGLLFSLVPTSPVK
jgi:hypothetical protein